MSVIETEIENNAVEAAASIEVAEREHADRLVKANAIVRNHALVAAGLGLVPMPIIDLVALTGAQLNLLRELGNLYGTEFKEDVAKKLAASLINGYLPFQFAAPLASAIKTIPLIGQTVGSVSMSVLGGGLTYAIGKVFVQHFESGGTFLDFDPKSVRAFFRQHFMEGVKITSKPAEA
jgi:uncharacterized protein (DUF697 family)